MSCYMSFSNVTGHISYMEEDVSDEDIIEDCVNELNEELHCSAANNDKDEDEEYKSVSLNSSVHSDMYYECKETVKIDKHIFYYSSSMDGTYWMLIDEDCDW